MASDKERIAILINTLIIGGAERTVSNLSRYLSDKYDIDIIVNDDRRIDFPYSGELISLGIPAPRTRLDILYQLKALFRRVRVLRKLKREKKYASVLSFSEMTNFVNVICRDRSAERRTKTIISVHNPIRKSTEKSRKHKLFTKFLLSWCLKHADMTVCCSGEIREELTKKYGLPEKNSRVIYNGLDLEEIDRLADEPPGKETEDRFGGGYLAVSVGRLTYQKGHWHLIRAINQLKDEGMDIKLVILGEGELRADYEKMIRQMDLEQTVFLPGFVKNPFPLIKKADAVVFPSLFEGFSNAIAEALACGVPCISSDHFTGARELLAPDSDFRNKTQTEAFYAPYGILVPVCDGKFRDPDEELTREETLMADAVRNVLTDPDLSAYYRKTAVKRASVLDVRSISAQWKNLIEGGG